MALSATRTGLSSISTIGIKLWTIAPTRTFTNKHQQQEFAIPHRHGLWRWSSKTRRASLLSTCLEARHEYDKRKTLVAPTLRMQRLYALFRLCGVRVWLRTRDDSSRVSEGQWQKVRNSQDLPQHSSCYRDFDN
jgi:hypothetical protein